MPLIPSVPWVQRAARGVRRRLSALRRDGGPAVAAAPTSPRPTPLRAERGGEPPLRATHPDVTVVIPVYNSAPWLDDCLSGVLAQTGVSLEVVCINDGSTDGSREILQRYADIDPRVAIIDQPNQGQSVGRNAGLDAAAGRFVVYLDSDDFWPKDTLAGLVAKADADELDVLMFDCFAFLDGEVDAATWKRYATYYQRSAPYDAVRSGAAMIADMRRTKDYRPHVGMYLARTAFIRATGVRFIPGIIHQDNPYTFALLLNAARVAHTDIDIYARRIRPGSTITTLNDARSVEGYFRSYVAMLRQVRDREFPPDVTEKLSEVVHGVFDAASKKVARLTDAELAVIKGRDGALDAQIAFQALKAFRTR